MASCARTGRIRRRRFTRESAARPAASLFCYKIGTKYMKDVLRLTKQDGTVVAQPLEIASNFISRGLGLMGRARLPENGGLLIHGCNGIHMMFMRFPIDAVFVDKKGVVLKTYERLLPWIGLVPLVWGADKVAELPVGTIRRHAIKPGDPLLAAD